MAKKDSLLGSIIKGTVDITANTIKTSYDVAEEIAKAGFKAATSKDAKKLMLESDEIWEKVRPFMNAENDQLFKNLRDIYREGIPSKDFSLDQINGSKKLYSILSEVGGRELVGKAKELSPGTFWVE